jgi:pyruvate,orthophosphate dikinase
VQQVALEAVAKEVMEEQRITVDYKFGTMIEIPRAALTAGEMAEYAQFFSFGTNDLTQTVFGISRDDAEAGFLVEYIQKGILPENPFASIDPNGVGKIMDMAVKDGRLTRPGMEIGICGEHGGDPKSIALCHEIGLDYVSCSPFRGGRVLCPPFFNSIARPSKVKGPGIIDHEFVWDAGPVISVLIH